MDLSIHCLEETVIIMCILIRYGLCNTIYISNSHHEGDERVGLCNLAANIKVDGFLFGGFSAESQ